MRPFNDQPFPYHTQLEVTIDNITNLGLGIARHDNWVIMVPNVAVGERVRCQIFRNHSNYSEADLIEVLEPSPERVKPLCPLFGLCGGCQYQHLRYETQLQLKQQHIRELFQKIARIEVPVTPVRHTDQTFHYRSKITPHFHKQAREIGFLKVNSRSEIIDVPQCCIATQAINKKLPQLREITRQTSHKRGGTLLLRDTGNCVENHPQAIIQQTVHQKTFSVYAGEFFQNNPFLLPDFIDYVVTEAADPGIHFLIDAYCGVGLFGICGNNSFEKVIGIEVNERAIALAQKNAIENQIKNIQFIAGTAEALFQTDLPNNTQTSIVIDPPRKGCNASFLQQLIQFAPKKIVYVSCAPDTQARDSISLLKAGYQIQHVQPFDLFPQTRHIENVVTFVKA